MRSIFLTFFLMIASVLSITAQETSPPPFCSALSNPPAVPANPSAAQTLNQSGLQLAARGDFTTAIVLFSQAAETDPSLVDAFLHRGCAYLATDNEENAHTDLERYVNSGSGAAVESVRAYLLQQGFQLTRVRRFQGDNPA